MKNLTPERREELREEFHNAGGKYTLIHPREGFTLLAASEELDTLRSETAAMREALTPSGDTKAAYHGEFEFAEDTMDDGARGPVWRTVPWTTIKEIMAAILARAERPAP